MLPEGMHFLRVEESIWPASANVLLIRDHDGAILVDVGCGSEKAYSRVKDFLSAHGLRMADVHTVILTHAHPDHMGAMKHLLQEISPRVFLHPLEIPLAAEPSRLNDTFDVGLPYRYGIIPTPPEEMDILEYFSDSCAMASARATDEIRTDVELVLGEFAFQVIETPGHAQGLVSLFNRENGILFTADAVGDIVTWYSPSSGGFTRFLEGLDRLSRLPATLLLPSHGSPSKVPSREIERTRTRVLRREERVIKELVSGPIPFPDLVTRVFKHPLMAVFPGTQILQCHLDKLEMEGRVICRGEDEGWIVELVGK
ncbi:MAG: MBL fold metallo-hydrolase [Actinobacteria bacterium]|nr:MBL fold metallo-hydrolase [Actinomycetota bacterium]MCG2818203.1 MBL fold metallo-hydrolase [Actinomycetes bacterium]MBU4219600.1 MBL fold metallo-hydrolase [Actinomycetota bacterium]MBU4358441.1 MBL fold metallo-hydrolase [Actinomycetota bacterium]MBU4392458.1 MBL fold metallo-hydrolase [Actinomycetota bacterium]